MPSQTRTSQIAQELTKLGVEPTQDAINAVLGIMRTNGRATVASASRRYAQSQQPQSPKSDRPPQQTGEAQKTLSAVTDATANKIKETILSKAVSKALADIESGNWGTLNDEAKNKLDEFKEFIEADFQVLDESFFAPSLPPSASNLLPSSEETISAEALPQ